MLSAEKLEEIKEQAFMGVPSPLYSNGKFIGNVYPLTVKEIISMGSLNYRKDLGLLLLTETDISNLIKEKINKEIPIEEIHVLKYLLDSASLDDTFLLELQLAFSTFFKEDVLLLPKINSVLIGSMEDRRLITEENFQDFQNILRVQNRKEVAAAPPKDETPGQRKMRLLREKVAAVKRKQAQKNGEEQSFVDLMEIASIFGIDIDNCSLYAFYGLLRRYQAREKWNQDLQMICAGADSKKMQTKYWGENLDE